MVISLAASGHQDSTALASSIETTLADGSLESTIEANLGVSVTVDQSSIILVQTTTVAPTLNPMPAQITTVAPTLNPKIAQAKKRVEIDSIVIVIAVVLVAARSTVLALKLQLPIMVFIGLSLAALLVGIDFDADPKTPMQGEWVDGGFWEVFAVFFPAVTGVLAGVGEFF